LSLQTSTIFIIGCPRSGTSIFSNFFKNNSKVVFFDEVDIWEKNKIIANQSIIRKLNIKLWKSLRRLIPATMFVRKIHWYTTQLLYAVHLMNEEKSDRLTENDLNNEMIAQVKYIIKKHVPAEKKLVVKSVVNSLRILFIKKLFPNAKFIHVIRDGRDVACSLVKGNEGKVWMHTKPPGWKEWQKKTTGPVRGAWIWNTIIKTIREDSKKLSPNNYYEVKYENFVKNPEMTLRSLFSSLDLPFEKTQEELCKKISNVQKKEYLTNTSSDDWASYDHSVRIGRYKQNLSTEMLKKVESVLGKTNSELGYS